MKKILGVFFAAVVLAFAMVGAQANASAASGCRVGFYAGGSYYTGTVTKSVRTSCPFAKNVAQKSLRFIIRAGGVGDGDFFVRVYSPVTQVNYRVHCWANGDLRAFTGMHVDCRAGIGARVVYTAHQH